jgi:hypothetical protein
LSNSKCLRGAYFLNSQGVSASFVPLGGQLRLRLRLCPPTALPSLNISIGIDNPLHERMLSIYTPTSDWIDAEANCVEIIECQINQLPLPPGEYIVKVAILSGGQVFEVIEPAAVFSVADSNTSDQGKRFTSGRCFARARWLYRQSLND